MFRTLVLGAICLYVSSICAQEKGEYYNYTQYTSESGLPHSLVFDITQSKDGFIWVATNNGLGRFDGYNFKIFRPQKDKKHNISGKSISQIFVDKSNNLWLPIQGIGLDRMNLANEKFTSYSPLHKDSTAILGNDVSCMFEDKDSAFWIGTNKGIEYYNRDSEQFVKITEKMPSNMQNISALSGDDFDRIWFLSQGKVYWFAKKDKKVYSLSDLVGDKMLDSLVTNSLLIENGSILWLATRNSGFLCVDLKTNVLKFKHSTYSNISNAFFNKKGDLFFIAFQPHNKFFVIPHNALVQGDVKFLFQFNMKSDYFRTGHCEDAEGNIWFSSNEGLLKVYSDFTVAKIRSKSAVDGDLLADNPTCRFIDNMGNLWLSSERKGVMMVDLHQKKFNHYKYLKETDKVISGNNSIMVFEDSKGKIWTGCYGEGISCYDPKTHTSRIIPYCSTDQTKAIYNAPAAIQEDAQGFLWIGFYDGALMKVDSESMKVEYFSEYKSGKNYFRGLSIRSLFIDKSNNLWITSNPSGLIERKGTTGEFIYHSELYESDIPSNSHYRHINQTCDGVFWTGTQNGGLGRYDNKTHQFSHYVNDASNPKSISGNTVYYTYEESDSILWVATDKGLNKFNRKTTTFTNYSYESNGFICAIYRIFPDNRGNLWLSGDCGIIKFNTSTTQYNQYTKADGLPATEFNTTSGCITRAGEMFFGSTNGFVSFFPDSIKANPYKSSPILTNLKIFNKTVSPLDTVLGWVVLDKSISLLKKITLPHYLNDFTLEFSAMHFSAPDKNQYQYKLVGFNEQWISVGALRRWANFTGLRPGLYTFYLRSTNNDGLLCEPDNMVALQIEILPPFFETWWFRLFMVLVFSFIVFLIFRLRIRIIKKQKEDLEKTIAERTIQLHDTNTKLEERHEEIEVQNEELERHRHHLEEVVEKRTHQLKKALVRAEETDRLKSAFLANMSHEIRTPMNAILGFSSLLREDDITPEEKNFYADIIVDNGETLLDLLNDILDRSVMEAGRLKITKKETDLNKLLNDIFIVFNNNKLIKENPNLTLEIENIHSIPFLIITDPLRLSQVLNNLIDNALKFTSCGKVTVSYTVQNEVVTFMVSDTGVGMEQNAIDFVFDRFHKIENPETVFYRGAGLGLAICQSLVEMLGGEIWVESSLGLGSTFYFTISVK